jgi:hypothetical protein
VLSGEVRGKGGAALVRHLSSTKGGQHVQLLPARFLAAGTLDGQLRELVAGAARGRTDRPVLHVHVDPPPGHDSPEVISLWLRQYEAEFGLQNQPRAGVLHSGKDGANRLHGHLIYSLVRPDGRIIDLRNSYRRREKVSVLVAYHCGLPVPPVPRPRAIHRQLLRQGRKDIASWLVEHCPGLHFAARVASSTPMDRYIAERTGQDPRTLLDGIAKCWPSPGPYIFRKRLAEVGLVLAVGTKAMVIVDATGTAHSLSRSLRKACRTAGQPIPQAAQVRAFLGDILLPSVETIRKMRSKMAPRGNTKTRIMSGITGEQVVAEFSDRTKFVKKGPPHRLYMSDGGWVIVDSAASRLIVCGPSGDADALAGRLVEIEPFAIERRPARERAKGAHLLKALRPSKGTYTQRFDWWVEQGQSPELRPDGIAIEVNGTFLFDRGNEIEVHDQPPSTEALDLIAQYAAAHWGGGLVLDVPPGAKDWSESDKARLWWSCRKHGVIYHGYNPPQPLLRRWEAENGQPPAGAASALRPDGGDGGKDEDREAEIRDRIAEVEKEIDTIESAWKSHMRDTEWIEKMRARRDQLREERLDLMASLSPIDRHQPAYATMRM